MKLLILSNYIRHFIDNKIIKNIDDKLNITSSLSGEVANDLRGG